LIVIGTACSTPNESNNPEHSTPSEPLTKQELALKRAAEAIEAKKKEKPVSFPKPQIGKVKEFFQRYGSENQETNVRLKTRLGNIDIRLYEETPLHRANFIYNIKNDLYYRTIFYRVIPAFMVQGGNSDNDRTLEKREHAGSYYIPNETQEGLIHKRGAVAMAMMYDDNPDLKSSQYSFYIVIGKPISEAGLDAVEEEYGITIPEQDRDIYKAVGGTPHLDMKHTVFGEVTQGMDVVEAIAAEDRDTGDWPITDVIIDYEILD
jgi:cyclophilin family peptidyl-prolyl cis-trans isomerase